MISLDPRNTKNMKLLQESLTFLDKSQCGCTLNVSDGKDDFSLTCTKCDADPCKSAVTKEVGTLMDTTLPQAFGPKGFDSADTLLAGMHVSLQAELFKDMDKDSYCDESQKKSTWRVIQCFQDAISISKDDNVTNKTVQSQGLADRLQSENVELGKNPKYGAYCEKFQTWTDSGPYRNLGRYAHAACCEKPVANQTNCGSATLGGAASQLKGWIMPRFNKLNDPLSRAGIYAAACKSNTDLRDKISATLGKISKKVHDAKDTVNRAFTASVAEGGRSGPEWGLDGPGKYYGGNAPPAPKVDPGANPPGPKPGGPGAGGAGGGSGQPGPKATGSPDGQGQGQDGAKDGDKDGQKNGSKDGALGKNGPGGTGGNGSSSSSSGGGNGTGNGSGSGTGKVPSMGPDYGGTDPNGSGYPPELLACVRSCGKDAPCPFQKACPISPNCFEGDKTVGNLLDDTTKVMGGMDPPGLEIKRYLDELRKNTISDLISAHARLIGNKDGLEKLIQGTCARKDQPGFFTDVKALLNQPLTKQEQEYSELTRGDEYVKATIREAMRAKRNLYRSQFLGNAVNISRVCNATFVSSNLQTGYTGFDPECPEYRPGDVDQGIQKLSALVEKCRIPYAVWQTDKKAFISDPNLMEAGCRHAGETRAGEAQQELFQSLRQSPYLAAGYPADSGISPVEFDLAKNKVQALPFIDKILGAAGIDGKEFRFTDWSVRPVTDAQAAQVRPVLDAARAALHTEFAQTIQKTCRDDPDGPGYFGRIIKNDSAALRAFEKGGDRFKMVHSCLKATVDCKEAIKKNAGRVLMVGCIAAAFVPGIGTAASLVCTSMFTGMSAYDLREALRQQKFATGCLATGAAAGICKPGDLKVAADEVTSASFQLAMNAAFSAYEVGKAALPLLKSAPAYLTAEELAQVEAKLKTITPSAGEAKNAQTLEDVASQVKAKSAVLPQARNPNEVFSTFKDGTVLEFTHATTGKITSVRFRSFDPTTGTVVYENAAGQSKKVFVEDFVEDMKGGKLGVKDGATSMRFNMPATDYAGFPAISARLKSSYGTDVITGDAAEAMVAKYRAQGKNPQAFYNPDTNQIVLPNGASLETFFHEIRHVEQFNDLAKGTKTVVTDVLAVTQKSSTDAVREFGTHVAEIDAELGSRQLQAMAGHTSEVAGYGRILDFRLKRMEDLLKSLPESEPGLATLKASIEKMKAQVAQADAILPEVKEGEVIILGKEAAKKAPPIPTKLPALKSPPPPPPPKLGGPGSPNVLFKDPPVMPWEGFSKRAFELCPECPKDYHVTSRSLDHASQHIPGETIPADIKVAQKYARTETSTTVFTDGTKPEALLKDVNLAEKIALDPKAKDLLAKGADSIAFDVELATPTATGTQKTMVRVVVCIKPSCADNAGGVITENAFAKGDLVSAIPLCGPAVMSIPKLADVMASVAKYKPESPMGTGSGKMKMVPCK